MNRMSTPEYMSLAACNCNNHQHNVKGPKDKRTLYSRVLAAILKVAPFFRSRGSLARIHALSTFVPCPAQ